ncbi:hypothetical protein [Caenispirillum bisanense]|uniref:hypothetical protein n=1 Tax=Caenispirillum bisanense TaxID=414052 RepID=UPI0031D708B8
MTAAAAAALPAFARRALRALGAIVLVLPLLSGCYLPDRFQSEIRLARTGEYGVYYKGDLTWLPLVKDLREGRVTQAELPEKMAVLERDLARDGSFSTVRAIGPGAFTVEYNRIGKLARPDLVTFVRRNARIISLQTDEQGVVSMTASQAIKLIPPEAIEQAGLNSRGLLRVTTNARVLDHNADSVRPGPQGFMLYDWKINGVRGQEPRLKAQLD